MNLTVLTDEAGKILFIQKLNIVNDIKDLDVPYQGEATVIPEAGQLIHTIDIPAELEKIEPIELLTRFRVNLECDKPELQPLEDSA